MTGPPDQRGVNTRALDELFQKSQQRTDEWVDTINVPLPPPLPPLPSPPSHTGPHVLRSLCWKFTMKRSTTCSLAVETRSLPLSPPPVPLPSSVSCHSIGLRLQVKQGPQGNFVPGLTQIPVTTNAEVIDLLAVSDRNRSQSCTNMNEHSSRSHMMLTVTITSENKITGITSRGKLNLVSAPAPCLHSTPLSLCCRGRWTWPGQRESTSLAPLARL
jgi:hypothetical protein